VRADRFDLHVFVFSEDSSGKALPVVRALAKSMLRLVDPSHREERVDLEPKDEAAQVVMHGNRWKGKDDKGYTGRGIVARTIATHILAERSVVLVHVDADRRWKDREKDKSENIARFHEKLMPVVTSVVDEHIAKNPGKYDKQAVMSRLCLAAPYSCIESWVYQNTAVAQELCNKHHRGADVKKFEKWEQDRGLLDEEINPHERVFLRSQHNHKLATHAFPGRPVYEARKSFHETVERLKSIPTVVSALAATHPGY
jgi:hypothetical protein